MRRTLRVVASHRVDLDRNRNRLIEDLNVGFRERSKLRERRHDVYSQPRSAWSNLSRQAAAVRNLPAVRNLSEKIERTRDAVEGRALGGPAHGPDGTRSVSTVGPSPRSAGAAPLVLGAKAPREARFVRALREADACADTEKGNAMRVQGLHLFLARDSPAPVSWEALARVAASLRPLVLDQHHALAAAVIEAAQTAIVTAPPRPPRTLQDHVMQLYCATDPLYQTQLAEAPAELLQRVAALCRSALQHATPGHPPFAMSTLPLLARAAASADATESAFVVHAVSAAAAATDAVIDAAVASRSDAFGNAGLLSTPQDFAVPWAAVKHIVDAAAVCCRAQLPRADHAGAGALQLLSKVPPACLHFCCGSASRLVAAAPNHTHPAFASVAVRVAAGAAQVRATDAVAMLRTLAHMAPPTGNDASVRGQALRHLLVRLGNLTELEPVERGPALEAMHAAAACLRSLPPAPWEFLAAVCTSTTDAAVLIQQAERLPMTPRRMELLGTLKALCPERSG